MSLDDAHKAAVKDLFTQLKPHFEHVDLSVATVVLTYMVANWLTNFADDDRPNALDRLVQSAIYIIEADRDLRSRPQ